MHGSWHPARLAQLVPALMRANPDHAAIERCIPGIRAQVLDDEIGYVGISDCSAGSGPKWQRLPNMQTHAAIAQRLDLPLVLHAAQQHDGADFQTVGHQRQDRGCVLSGILLPIARHWRRTLTRRGDGLAGTLPAWHEALYGMCCLRVANVRRHDHPAGSVSGSASLVSSTVDRRLAILIAIPLPMYFARGSVLDDPKHAG